jgi:tRNA threonylcarbamoyladenosine biosynthesis protein TsaB
LKIAIDSSQTSGSIAIHDGQRLLYSEYFDIRITHSETLMPSLDKAMKLCGFGPREISEIYVCSGPGSFTGLRIGIATAKGIAYALGIPVHTFNSLEMTALSCTPYRGNILCIIDAKMQECYAALYDENLNEIVAPAVLKAAEILSWPIEGCIVCGSAAQLLLPFAEEKQLILANPLHNIPKAEALFFLAQYSPGKIYAGKALAELEPFYIRDSTAQIKARKAQESAKQINQ